MNKKFKLIRDMIVVISFIVFTIGTIVCAFIGFVHAVKNPELTATQNMIYAWDKFKVWIIGSVASCLCLFGLKK